MPPPKKRASGSSLAGTAGDQVRAIIEAAEQTAAQIRAKAEEDAARLRAETRAEAKALVEELRSRVARLSQELGLTAEREGASEVELAEDAAVGLDEPDDPASPPRLDEADQPASPPRPTPAPTSAGDADLDSARLVALNMALDGQSREEVDRYLSENFQLSDQATLLDEVYARVGR